eukprot:CAMPEP_0201242584 /NCGR_PEP_ID=MMETSP0852-20130820/38497_1 /ASSEMBLY_ACC=CAM_ASM_000632 /TAXON_ID=183588 /ORGANISM="Pseudo-nitzschia fraudulenta, Strain WWA7" /LENGTH=179 /DNA_ID=CAMNT_0047539311 /DNA_START=468 /DNA_END=1007 /DNA_ORIENTATION=-
MRYHSSNNPRTEIYIATVTVIVVGLGLQLPQLGAIRECIGLTHGDHQPTTRFGRVTGSQSEVQDFVVDFEGIRDARQGMEFDTAFGNLVIHEILGVAQNTESGDIGGGMGVVFRHDFGRNPIEFRHRPNGFVHHGFGLRERQKGIVGSVSFNDIFPKPVLSGFFVLFPPLVHVDGNLRS